jgi:hypothetical protein
VSNSHYYVDNKLSSGRTEFYGISDIMLVSDVILMIQLSRENNFGHWRITSDTDYVLHWQLGCSMISTSDSFAGYFRHPTTA